MNEIQIVVFSLNGNYIGCTHLLIPSLWCFVFFAETIIVLFLALLSKVSNIFNLGMFNDKFQFNMAVSGRHN